MDITIGIRGMGSFAVLCGIGSGLEGVGLTFYHLNDLQDIYREREGSVVEVRHREARRSTH